MTLESGRTAVRHGSRTTGTIVALHLCPGPRSRSVLQPVPRVTALEDRGLEGDRHARKGRGRQVLIVEQEVLAALGLEPGQIREQVTVSGIDLDALVQGSRLRAGTAEFEVAGPCEPCERMNEIRPGLQQVLDGRRGRFVRVTRGGTFGVGDTLETVPAS